MSRLPAVQRSCPIPSCSTLAAYSSRSLSSPLSMICRVGMVRQHRQYMHMARLKISAWRAGWAGDKGGSPVMPCLARAARARPGLRWAREGRPTAPACGQRAPASRRHTQHTGSAPACALYCCSRETSGAWVGGWVGGRGGGGGGGGGQATEAGGGGSDGGMDIVRQELSLTPPLPPPLPELTMYPKDPVLPVISRVEMAPQEAPLDRKEGADSSPMVGAVRSERTAGRGGGTAVRGVAAAGGLCGSSRWFVGKPSLPLKVCLLAGQSPPRARCGRRCGQPQPHTQLGVAGGCRAPTRLRRHLRHAAVLVQPC